MTDAQKEQCKKIEAYARLAAKEAGVEIVDYDVILRIHGALDAFFIAFWSGLRGHGDLPARGHYRLQPRAIISVNILNDENEWAEEIDRAIEIAKALRKAGPL